MARRRRAPHRSTAVTVVAAVGLVLAFAVRLPAAVSADAPFAAAASAGPQAASRVDARVTRVVDGVRSTLPGASVPDLQPGDVVDVRFPDYTRPPALANYHVDVAFITEVAPQRWLFERSVPEDRLFAPQTKRRKRTVAAPQPGLHFIYGSRYYRGIPIFFIVPEDAKTRGMDGVRDYVGAHPTDFKDMAQSANDAADKYQWFADFLTALATGSIDPISARQRVESIATSLGANPASIDACYAAGGSSTSVAACIKTSLDAVSYSTNIEAPTQAQFFGGAFGAVAPVAIASYLVPLLDVWKLFIHTGHREYEYLPTTLAVAANAANSELLMGLKVPTLRPPAAYSDALFFTIGDPLAAASPPTVTDVAEKNGTCAGSARLPIPLHLDRTSAFIHDTHLVVTPDGAAAYSIPLDPRSIDTPSIDAAQLTGAADGAYTIRIDGRFGFERLRQAQDATARVAVPRTGGWSVAALPHRPAVAGEALDFVATSPSAPCLARAELQIGSQPPIALDVKRLSDRRVALHASLANVPPGEAHLRLYASDARHDRELEDDVAVAIAPKPAQVDAKREPVAYLGDPFIALSGTAFETIAGLRLGGASYLKDPGSNAADACFRGAPIGGAGLEPGESLSTALVEQDGAPGQVFETKIAAARPVVSLTALVPDAPTHLSTQLLAVTLSTAPRPLPARREIRLRRAVEPATPCAAFATDPSTDAVIPAADSYEQSATTLSVNLDAARTLADRAFGQIQVQLVDLDAHTAANWLTLPGMFVRAPRVSRIECPADPAAPCALLGTGLTAIAGIVDDSGAAFPGVACAPHDTLACLTVPRRAHYILRLADGNTMLALPQTPVAPATPEPPTPSAAPGKPLLR